MAHGGNSDLETPLLVSEQPHEKEVHFREPGGRGSSKVDGGTLPRKAQSKGGLRRLVRESSRLPFHSRIKDIEEDEPITFFEDEDGITKGKREYNRKQRETLEGFREVDIISSGGRRAVGAQLNAEDSRVKRPINLSNFMNAVLLILKIYASVRSGSLAIVASTLDSLLDLVAGFILWLAHWYTERASHNYGKYPIGGLRIQPVGIVVFSAIMTTLGLQVFLAGLEELMEGQGGTVGISELYWLIFVMGFATIVKLALYFYCASFDDEIVRTYAMDHSLDVITNVAGLAAVLLANFFAWWIDPSGAIVLACYTIYNWGKSMLETAMSLVGQAAPAQFCQKVTYMALNHHPKIERIDTVRAYTFGSMYFVEVDIQLPGNMELKDAHKIGEDLQNSIELLPEVERAFVHLDFECSHRPEHSSS